MSRPALPGRRPGVSRAACVCSEQPAAPSLSRGRRSTWMPKEMWCQYLGQCLVATQGSGWEETVLAGEGYSRRPFPGL